MNRRLIKAVLKVLTRLQLMAFWLRWVIFFRNNKIWLSIWIVSYYRHSMLILRKRRTKHPPIPPPTHTHTSLLPATPPPPPIPLIPSRIRHTHTHACILTKKKKHRCTRHSADNITDGFMGACERVGLGWYSIFVFLTRRSYIMYHPWCIHFSVFRL